VPTRKLFQPPCTSRSASAHGSFDRHVRLDRRDEAQLVTALREVEPDILVDLACFQPGEVDAVVRTFTGTRYLFMSTGVYPNLFGKTATEGDFVPLAGEVSDGDLEYMQAKRWCETVLFRHQQFPWTVIRPPAIFGARDYTLRIAAYIERMLDGARCSCRARRTNGEPAVRGSVTSGARPR